MREVVSLAALRGQPARYFLDKINKIYRI
jgi:hypothetical protein